MVDEETRKTVLRFLRAFKSYQTRTLGMKKFIDTMARMSPSERSALTNDQFWAVFKFTSQQGQERERFQEQVAPLEQALGDDESFLRALANEEAAGKLDDFVDGLMQKIQRLLVVTS